MIDRVSWAFYVTGMATVAVGLFAFPWLSSGSHGCYAVVGGDCTIANGNTAAAVVLLGVSLGLGVWRLRRGTESVAPSIGLAVSALGIGYCVFTFNYDSFSAPIPVFTSPPTHAQLRDLLWTGDLGPSTGFALTLLGVVLLVAAALTWAFSRAAASPVEPGPRRMVAGVGVASALLAVLGAWLPWVHLSPASAVLDTDHGTVGAAAVALLVSSVYYLVVGGRGWMTALIVSAGLLCTVAVYQWFELRWEQTDMQLGGAHVALGSGIRLSLVAGVLAGATAAAALLVELPRRSRTSIAVAGAFVVVLLGAGLVSRAMVDGRPHNCASGVFGERNGQLFSRCISNGSLGALSERSP